MKRILLLLSLVAFSALVAFAQFPKREFRGAWIATVSNLDWPSNPTSSTDAQKADLIGMLDRLKAAGFNAVVFQVRPECDALYASPYEPWSYWLTGQQGRAPNPYYDPLQFAVEEAHKRGMELHAWFNPYRAVVSVGSYSQAAGHVTNQHQDWILGFNKLRILNPGIPAVRDYVTMVIMDVVRRYDVDGVHFDDYFYPYEGIRNEDAATYAQYNPGGLSLGDWRRDNVNKFIKMVHDSIQLVKPYVKFGISPFGIWKSGTPPGTSGLDAYSELYADAVAWLNAKTIDYVTPQLYWKIGGPQDYEKLMPWWESVRNGRHLYTGHILSLSAAEITRQLRFNRGNSGVSGSILFRAGILSGALTDSLRSIGYGYPSLLPVMAWKDSVPPNPPRSLAGEVQPAGIALKWDAPIPASDGDTASRYAVYRLGHVPAPSELEDVQNIFAVTGTPSLPPPAPPATTRFFYVVTALDRNYNESVMTTPLAVEPVAAPAIAATLSYPEAGDTNVATLSLAFRWNRLPIPVFYRLQVSRDSAFTSPGVILDIPSITDTNWTATSLPGYQKLYWRVGSGNSGGSGPFSEVRSFTTGLAVPVPPVLAYPATSPANVPLNPTFAWSPSPYADSYEIQVSLDPTFAQPDIDSSGISDTSFTVAKLWSNRLYSWRVRGRNTVGYGNWAAGSRFRTMVVSAVQIAENMPEHYDIRAVYPNPFNPTTTVAFDVPRQGFVALRVYNLIGQEVATLVSSDLMPGAHTVIWNGQGQQSGVYFLRLTTSEGMFTRKLLLLK